ncbi:MAG: hypothetical protein P1P84_19360 [Deferrisomatales bacterium]|nr:hypothetical protein [Deferrisomatales bacterium]
MKLAVSVLCLTLALSSVAFANGPSDLPEKFMKQVVAGKGAEAIDEYFATNPLVAQKAQQVQFIKTQIEAVFNIFGKPTSYELAIEDDLAPSLKRYVFITKHDHHALTWEFYSYKPKDVWIASNMNFNDNYSLLERKK